MSRIIEAADTWDFRLESVKSINTSGHKFGLVYPGIGWLLFRDEDQLPEDLVFYEDYLGQRDATFTLNFSGSASFVLAQYYMLLREGREGYESLVRAMTMNRDALADRLRQVDALTLLTSDRPTLPLLVAKVNEDEAFTANDLVADLTRRNGWLIPAYYMPPKNEKQQIIRMLVKFTQTRELVEALADDFDAAVDFLRQAGKVGGISPVKPAVHSGHGY